MPLEATEVHTQVIFPSAFSLRQSKAARSGSVSNLAALNISRRSIPRASVFKQVENNFYEMKGDVGMTWMSRHEKEREQEDAYTKTESHS